MGEHEVVLSSTRPWSGRDVGAMAAHLGIQAGDTVIVHSSLSSMGWVCGGAQAVVEGLIGAVGPAGTLVMPAHSGGNSEPSHWSNPPVPEGWWAAVRETMPAYDPLRTPTRGIGSVAELFRTWPAALRSAHPQVSFTAFGKHAKLVTSEHKSLRAFGEDSPLARIYELDGKILLIGVGHDRNTSMHLGEARSGTCGEISQGAAVMAAGKRRWVSFEDIDVDSDRFPGIAKAFEESGGSIIRGSVCEAPSQLISQRDIVDFTERYLRSMKEYQEQPLK